MMFENARGAMSILWTMCKSLTNRETFFRAVTAIIDAVRKTLSDWPTSDWKLSSHKEYPSTFQAMLWKRYRKESHTNIMSVCSLVRSNALL